VSAVEQRIAEAVARHYADRAGAASEREIPLEAYAAGELEPAQRAEVESHISGCDSCKAALREFEAVAELWATPAVNEASLLTRLRSWLSPPRLLAPAALAAAALLAVVLIPAGEEEAPLRAKGSFRLHVAVERNGHAFRLQDGVRLETGDRLGFFYNAARGGFLTILYGEADGDFVRLYPALAGQSAAVEVGSEVRVPDGALISPGQGCEWVVSLFTETPLGAADAEAAVEHMWSTRDGCKLGTHGLPEAEVQVVEVQR